jgi:hypothetical protein
VVCTVQAANPVVTRKDSAEAESRARSIGLAGVMRPGGESGYFGTRNLFSLTASPGLAGMSAWPGQVFKSMTLWRLPDSDGG